MSINKQVHFYSKLLRNQPGSLLAMLKRRAPARMTTNSATPPRPAAGSRNASRRPQGCCAARRTKCRHPQRACGFKAASRVGDPAQDQSKTRKCFEPTALFALDPRRRIASGRSPSRMTEEAAPAPARMTTNSATPPRPAAGSRNAGRRPQTKSTYAGRESCAGKILQLIAEIAKMPINTDFLACKKSYPRRAMRS